MFSAAKLFFAYGLGNALTFPLAVGATARADGGAADARRGVPRAGASTSPTVFFGVPTLYAALLAHPDLPRARPGCALRLCIVGRRGAAGDIGERWSARTGVEILDGIGSTEMLHIFLSNRPGDVRYGTTGQPVPGYDARAARRRRAARRPTASSASC